MEDRIRSLLEEYNISQLLLMLDIPEEEMLELMVNYGLIEWERLVNELEWPVTAQNIIEIDTEIIQEIEN